MADQAASTAGASGETGGSWFTGIFRPRRSMEQLGLLVALIALVLLIGLVHPDFLTAGSAVLILRQASFLGLMVYGMVFLISMGELDLSIGGIYAISATTMAVLVSGGVSPALAAVLGVAAGGALGATNGVVAGVLNVPLIIVSLGSLSVFRGLNLIISGGRPVSGMPRDDLVFRLLGGSLLGVPAATWVLGVAALVLGLVYRRGRFGVTVRSIGSNREAAAFVGLRVARTRIVAAALMGSLAGVAGVLALAFFKSADPSLGVGTELTVIAAAIIGGTALSGGSGSVWGATLGMLVLSTIAVGLVFFGVTANQAQLVTGVVILLAVALDRAVKSRSTTD